MKKGEHHSKESREHIAECKRRWWASIRKEREEFYDAVVKMIRARREKLGLTRNEVADLAGLNPIHYEQIEFQFKVHIELRTFVKICAALGMKMSDLAPTRRFTKKPRATKKILRNRKKFIASGRDISKKTSQWKVYQKDIIRMRSEGMSIPAIARELDLTSFKTVQLALSEEFRERIYAADRARSRAKSLKRKQRGNS